jgi:hypothetical protein
MKRDGSLDIIQENPYAPPEQMVYTLVFAFVGGRNGAQPTRKITGREALLEILRAEANLAEHAISDALEQFTKKKTATLPRVPLTDQQRSRLGLLYPDEKV